MARIHKWAGLALLMLLPGACNSTPPAKQAAAPTHSGMTEKQIAQALVTDPCPLRLQDISDAMLLYFSSHNRTLPKSLEELRAYTQQISGAQLQLTCPTSGEPYVYVPEGLQVEGQKWILFVYDAEASHNGIRWAIVAAPAEADHPVTMRVVPMDDHTLQAYLDGSLVHP